MAIILAILVEFITGLVSVFILFAYGMSDEPDNGGGKVALVAFCFGSIISMIVLLSHWFPHISW